MKGQWAAGILAVVGFGMISTSLLAVTLGLDHNAAWGTGRILVFALGSLTLATAWLVYDRARLANGLPAEASSANLGRDRNELSPIAGGRGLLVTTGLVALGVVLIYIFMISNGTWLDWPETSRYNDDLATAFRVGQLNLAISPPQAFLALPDPYEPSLRNSLPDVKKFVDQVWDLSFFEGKFYLYWGPVPALLILITRAFYPGPVPDQILVFSFSLGTFILEVLLLLKLWRRYFSAVPSGLLACGVVLVGLAFPIPVMLGRAAVYEATIAAGQFFLIAGVFSAYLAIEKAEVSKSLTLLAVVAWALAAGSRTIALIPAAFLSFMLIRMHVDQRRGSQGALQSLGGGLLLGSPLILVLLATGWYNWARFGSPLEFGLRYQLTSQNLNKYSGEIFSLSYVLPSLWAYLFTGFGLASRFPFIVLGSPQSPAYLLPGASDLYHYEEAASLILSSPIVLFALVTVARTGWLAWKRLRAERAPQLPDRPRLDPLAWISVSLIGAALLTFLGYLAYFNISLRFFGEFASPLMLTSVLGIWEGYQLATRSGPARVSYVLVALILTVATVGLSILIAISADFQGFRHNNPQLVKELTRFFGP